jgi:hypothetical protein
VSPAATGELVVLALTTALAALLYLAMRLRFVVFPGAATRIFAAVMTAHAVVNLIGRNWLFADADAGSIVVANLAALLYLAVYGNALVRHGRKAVLAALALLFATYAVFVALTASRWVPFDAALFLYVTAFAAFGALVLHRAGARSVAWTGGRLRASRSR